VLSRGLSGDEVFRVRHERDRERVDDEIEIEDAGEGSSGGSGGSGGSGMTAVISREERGT